MKAAGKTIKKPRRNVLAVEPTEGESHLKGFVSAFATIMDRPTETIVPSTPTAETAIEPKKSKREEKAIVGHDKQPALSGVETEASFAKTAERGVVKLFRAVAMSRKRAIEEEQSRGIGVTKSGQIRRKRVPKPLAAASSESKSASASHSMSSFLDKLKQSRTKPIVS